MLDAATPDPSELPDRISGSENSVGALPSGMPLAELEFGDYLLQEEIAHGGMGVIYRARQRSLDRTVAVKLLLLGRYSSADSIERFKREAQAAAALRHPNIVAVHDVGQFDGQHFIAMEYVEGRNLAEILREGPTSPRQAAEYAQTIADAIQYAHTQGVVHRDLKPSNILIDALGQLRITDFGLAKRFCPPSGTPVPTFSNSSELKPTSEGVRTRDPQRTPESDLTNTGQVLGTPNYLSPEAAAGRQNEVGPASDVYAIGALLYELLTGRPPFLAQSLQDTLLRIRDSEPIAPSSVNPGVPLDLETICLKCLEKPPSARYASARALAEDLGFFLAHKPIVARPISSLARAFKWTRRQPVLAAMIGVTVAILAALLATLSISNVRIRAAIQRAEAERRQANTARERAEAERETTRLNLYAADLYAARQVLSQGNLGLTERILEWHQPKPGETDLRGFEWHYLKNMTRGDHLAELPSHTDEAVAVVFSPDGQRLATGSYDGTFKVLEVSSRIVMLTDSMASNRVHSVSFSMEGRFLAVGRETSMEVWELNSRERIARTNSRIAHVAFSPTSDVLAVGDKPPDGAGPYPTDVVLWNFATGTQSRLKQAGGRIAFTPDGRLLATTGADRAITLWDTETWQAVRRIDTREVIFNFAISPDSRRLAACDFWGRVDLWDLTDGSRIASLVEQPADRIRSLVFLDDGQTLATVGVSQAIEFWDVATRRKTLLRHGHGSEGMSVAFSRAANLLVTGDRVGRVLLWNHTAKAESEATGSAAEVALQHGSNPWSPPLFSPDGRALAALGRLDGVQWIDPTSNRLFRSLPDSAVPIGFSPDSKLLVTAENSQRVKINTWDTVTGERLGGFDFAVNRSWSSAPIRISPRADLLAVSDYGKVSVLHLLERRVVATLPGRHGGFHQLAFSRDGAWLAATADQYTVKIWDAAKFREIGSIRHQNHISCLAFSPDGQILASASLDATTGLWRMPDGAPLHSLRGHKDFVRCVDWSPNGRTVATCGDDRTVRLWHVATGRELMIVGEPGRYPVMFAGFAPRGDALVALDGQAGPLRFIRVPRSELNVPEPGPTPDPRWDASWQRLRESSRDSLRDMAK